MGTTLGTLQLPIPALASSSARRQCLLWSGPFPPRRDLCNPDG
jgi:hypothetical protein